MEAFCIYGSVGRVEEPYVSITKKKQMPRGGQSEEVEQQVGQAEGKLFTHRAAFSRTSVIQAFLGSAPQLTLQLYICVLQETVSIGRGERCNRTRFESCFCNCGRVKSGETGAQAPQTLPHRTSENILFLRRPYSIPQWDISQEIRFKGKLKILFVIWTLQIR